MVYEAFFPFDVTVVLKTPSDTDVHVERHCCTGWSQAAGLNKLPGVHCGCSAKCPAPSALSSLTDSLTAFLLQLYS